MNYEIAQQIMDAKPMQAQHIFIDQDDKPRDRHIEDMFRSAFYGKPLDAIFRNNFEVYLQEFTGRYALRVPKGVFIDTDTAIKWIEADIGGITVRALTKRELAREHADPDLAHMRYLARLKIDGRAVQQAYGPSTLHAALLSVILLYRNEATKRLNKFFAPALK